VSLDIPSPLSRPTSFGGGSPGRANNSPGRGSREYNDDFALSLYTGGEQEEVRYAELLGGNRRSKAPNEDALELFNAAQVEQQRQVEETLGVSATLGDSMLVEGSDEELEEVEAAEEDAFEEIDPYVS
jgi:hypothetical protein